MGDVNKGMTNHKVRTSRDLVPSNCSAVYQNIESSDKALLVFGNGDGGGGPLAAMLENVISFVVLPLWRRSIWFPAPPYPSDNEQCSRAPPRFHGAVC